MTEHVRETASELPVHAARLAVMGVGQALMLTDRVRKDYREARESGLGPVLGRLRDDAGTVTGRLLGRVTRRIAGDGAPGTDEPPQAAADGEIAVGKPRTAPGRTRPATTSTAPSGRRTAGTSRPAASPSRSGATASRPAPGSTTAAQAKAAAEARARSASRPAARPATPPPGADEGTSGGEGAAPAAARPAGREKPPAKAGDAGAAPATGRAAAPPAGDEAAAALPVPDYDAAPIASVRARLRKLSARQVGELRDYERAHAARAEFLRMYENRIAKLRGQS